MLRPKRWIMERNDEVGELAGAFDRTLVSLKHASPELKKESNSYETEDE